MGFFWMFNKLLKMYMYILLRIERRLDLVCFEHMVISRGEIDFLMEINRFS